jgi:signal peptidase II
MGTGIRLISLTLVMLSTIGCDRVTKHMATAILADKPMQSFLADSVRFVYAENTGGFLSLGADLSPVLRNSIFAVTTGLILAAILVTLLRSSWSFWRSFGVALFVAGGISNWIDRVLRGSVVDFMNVGVGWLRTGIFNFADVAILLGVAIFLLSEFWPRPPDITSRRAPE